MLYPCIYVCYILPQGSACGMLLCNLIQGLQSANPHNDYCQHFVDTGERPQNFIRDVGMSLISIILTTVFVLIIVCFSFVLVASEYGQQYGH